jgi:chloride channel 7
LPQVHGSLSSKKFGKLEFRKGVKIHVIQLDIGEEKMFLDMHPITNTSPYRLVETMSFAKAYALFQLGLRHIYVMPKSSKVHT